MQYILTQEEYDKLNVAYAGQNNMPTQKKLQEFCTHIADTVSVGSGWYKGKPWGCILSRKTEWYCDECPAQKVCPHPHKHMSK